MGSEHSFSGREGRDAVEASFAYRSILDMALKPDLDGPTPETQLASLLGLSRAPVRKALRRLEREGVVFRVNSSSVASKKIPLDEYIQGQSVRELLEGEAAFLAAGRVSLTDIAAVRRDMEALWRPSASFELQFRLDDCMHNLTIEACGNPIIADLARSVRTSGRLCAHRPAGMHRTPARVEASFAEHMRILDALEARDPQAAKRAMTAHVRSLTRHKVKGVH